MDWNYRLCAERDKQDNAVYLSIRKVFYNKIGIPDIYDINAIRLASYENINDIKWDIDKIKIAIDKPIIDLDNFPNEYKQIKQ